MNRFELPSILFVQYSALLENREEFFQRNMDRGILVGNRLCARRVEENKHARHLNKITAMRASIDNSPPVSATLGHLRVNLKREQLIEDSYTDIDRANRILLQKMSDIIRKPPASVGGPCGVKPSRSLNHDSRRKELKRITDENQSILRRIQHAQSSYDRVRWEQEFRKTRMYLKNKCEHPLVLEGGKQGISPPSVEPAPCRPDNAELESVLKEGKRIGETFYLIEINSDGEGLWISAFSGQEPEGSLELYVDKRRMQSEMEGDYGRLLKRVTVKKGRLVLDD